MKIKFAVFVILMFSIANVGIAQEETKNKLTELAVEISHEEDKYPKYWKVSNKNRGRTGLNSSALFNKIPDSESDEYLRSIKGLDLVSERIHDSVKVRVFIIRKVENRRPRELVTEFTLYPNVTRKVDELREYGIEPIEMRLIEVVAKTEKLPEIINDNPSIAVKNIKTIYPVLPSYRITVQNNSDKHLRTLVYTQNTRNGAGGGGQISFKREGAALAPGLLREITIRNFNESVEIRRYRNLHQTTETVITFTCIIFEDNSYEGDQKCAANHTAPFFGYKLQAEKIIKIVEDNVGKENSIASMKAQAEKLSVALEASEFRRFISNYPNLTEKEIERVKKRLNLEIDQVRRNFLFQLNYVTKNDITPDQKWSNYFIQRLKRRFYLN